MIGTAPLSDDDTGDGRWIEPGLHRIETLGRSRTHEVVLAWDETLLTTVAVKFLLPEHASDPAARASLANEAQALRTLQHPSLPRCFSERLDGPRPHLVMELVEGPRLSTLIRRQGLLGVEQALPLALQLCAALHYMGERDMVHLDVKPKNVIMAPPPRLIDLSIARSVAVARTRSHPIGTDRYMAPEQCGAGEHELIGPPTDVWGLGATLFEAVNGEPAFPPGDPDARGAERFPQLAVEPREMTPHVPRALGAPLRAALERRPHDRPTAAEIVAVFGPIAEITPPRLFMGRFRVNAWRVREGAAR